MADDDFLVGADADSLLTDRENHLAVAESSVTQTWEGAIAVLEEGIRAGRVPDSAIAVLVDAIPANHFATEEIGADFDMMAELGMQRALVNALRNKVMLSGGKGLAKGVSIQEAKSVMDSCRQFGEVIRKNMDEVVNLERIQALEAAILATVADYDEPFKRKFTKQLDKNLKVFCKK